MKPPKNPYHVPKSVTEAHYLVYVDGKDGDLYENYISMIWAVTHALKKGANKVVIEKE